MHPALGVVWREVDHPASLVLHLVNAARKGQSTVEACVEDSQVLAGVSGDGSNLTHTQTETQY